MLSVACCLCLLLVVAVVVVAVVAVVVVVVVVVVVDFALNPRPTSASVLKLAIWSSYWVRRNF